MKSVNGIARLNVPLHSGNGAMSVAKLPHQLIHMQAYLEVFTLPCSVCCAALLWHWLFHSLLMDCSAGNPVLQIMRVARIEWIMRLCCLTPSFSHSLSPFLSLSLSVREHAPYGKQRPDIESHILFKWQNCQPIWQAIPNEPSPAVLRRVSSIIIVTLNVIIG